MIREANQSDVDRIPPASEAAVKLLAMWQCYHPYSIGRFWADEYGSLLGLLDGAAVFFTQGHNAEEWCGFFTMNTDIRVIRTDGQTAERCAPHTPFALQTGVVMSPSRYIEQPDTKEEPPSLQAYYTLLSDVFGQAVPPFDVWYVDVSHRLRHGFSRLCGVTDGNIACAGAMTTAETANAAVIGAVATHPDYRGKGYASRIVLSLASQLQQEGKTVFLSPKNEYAKELYHKIGFEPVATWGNLNR